MFAVSRFHEPCRKAAYSAVAAAMLGLALQCGGATSDQRREPHEAGAGEVDSRGAGGAPEPSPGTEAGSAPRGGSDASAREDARADANVPRDARADDSPSDAASGMTVTGSVLSPMHEPLAGWAVALGDAVTATDAAGRFVFRNVTPPYDVAFRNPGVPNTTSSPDVWLYRGLTRSDPTLQPGYVLGNHEGHAYFVSGKVTAADGGEATLSYSLSFGSPYVTWTVASGAPFGSLGVEMRWFQTPAPAALHLLTWAPNSDPLSYEYLSYREETFATVSDVVSAGRTLDFTPNAVETATYSAIVTAAWGDARTRRILYPAVVFDDHATHVLRGIVYDTLHSNPVGLGLPVLPGAHAVFLAFQGDLNPLSRGPFGAAHRVAASPDTPVTLDLPEPRTLLRPGADATIGAATEFA